MHLLVQHLTYNIEEVKFECSTYIRHNIKLENAAN